KTGLIQATRSYRLKSGRSIEVTPTLPQSLKEGETPCRAGRIEHERRHSLRVHRREQDRDRTAIGSSVERSAFGPHRVHYGDDVLNLLLEQRCAAGDEGVRQTGTTLVQPNQPSEPGETVVVRAHHRVKKAADETRHRSRYSHKVHRAFATHLIRNA